MRWLARPLLLPLLRRRTDEVIRRAVDFRIDDDDDLEVLGSLGHAFISGYNTMLEADNLGAVSAAGMQVTTHFRPFFFEGAAMGYLPRGYVVAGCTRDRMERDVLGLRERRLDLLLELFVELVQLLPCGVVVVRDLGE